MINNNITTEQPDLTTAQKRVVACHRRYTPAFNSTFVNLPIVKRFAAALEKFDWHKCTPMKELRANGGAIVTKVYSDGSKRYRQLPPRRASIRKEREETLSALVPEIINNVEYHPNARYMYECMLSIEELARKIGQCHEYEAGYDGENGQYRHGRVAYDCVLGAIDDLEASKLIIVVREFDTDAKQYKASRLFLTPLFFESFGFSAKETKKLIHAAANNFKRKGKRYKRARPLNHKIANIDNRALRSVLDYHRRWYNGELLAETIEDKRKEKLKRFSAPQELSEAQIIERNYRAFVNQLPPIQVMALEDSIRKETPDISRAELYQRVIDKLKH